MEVLLEEKEEKEEGEDLNVQFQYLGEVPAHNEMAASDAQLSEPEEKSERPISYRENSAEEKRMLTMAASTLCQYSHLFPNRKPLLLFPENEFGVQKFVSTTLRPTPQPYHALYYWQDCASFVSDFLSLELLDPPTDPPKVLRSPTWVLQTQRGNCFEFSTLLCSLLLGAHYNAYCVSGYAVKEMCLLDQSRQECPVTNPQVKEESERSRPVEGKYKAKPLDYPGSGFEHRMEEKKQEEIRRELLKKQQEAQRLEEEHERPPPDPLLGMRVHSWVLVLSGRRDVAENFFIDPLTGDSFPTSSAEFLGIESIWNQHNYWINMQDCRFGCGEMSFDLSDPVRWESLLCDSSQSILPSPDMMKQQEAEEDEETEEPNIFEMPISWVSKILISQEDLKNRFPGGKKLIRYRKATVEKFAVCLRRDGLVTRVTTYKDLDCTQADTVRECYKDRNDYLEERELKKATDTTTERFRPGRSDALKCHRYVSSAPETERQMDFYSRSRDDDLASRVETPSEMTETFHERPDFLYHRHVFYGKLGEIPKQVQRPIQKVVEKFHRDGCKDPSEDVSEREFWLAEDCIYVTYHLEDDTIIRPYRKFLKPRDVSDSGNTFTFTPKMVSGYPGKCAKPASNVFLFETLKALMKEEKRVFTRIRDSEKEVREILASRQQEEGTVELQVSIYNTVRSEEDSFHREKSPPPQDDDLEPDFLGQFLIRWGNPKTLTREQALQVQNECLSEYKEHLEARANLIQKRLEKATQDLQQKQQWYQKNQLKMTEQEESEYLAWCSDIRLNIRVSKLRLSWLQESAPKDYHTLETKLREDPRLAPHLS
ncbi:dynein regulatory complex subunit 7 isoform X2 [Hoplias malabaricus]